ncbi:hypothetical protein [Candidatus Villigracilis affinis]|uniref:hypothetical protein n=1 Tax=Candidatus Villigracilis affinis TaxID=3140682 RepID=UPI002A1BBD6F|nr:hypothetical protein [Anaerolineales bacterium]
MLSALGTIPSEIIVVRFEGGNQPDPAAPGNKETETETCSLSPSSPFTKMELFGFYTINDADSVVDLCRGISDAVWRFWENTCLFDAQEQDLGAVYRVRNQPRRKLCKKMPRYIKSLGAFGLNPKPLAKL